MNHITSKEQYLNAKATWKLNKNRTAADHIIYNAIRGFDIKRGFSPITNETKLSNGAKEWAGFSAAKQGLKWDFREQPRNEMMGVSPEKIYADRRMWLSEKYGIEFTPELMEKIREVLK